MATSPVNKIAVYGSRRQQQNAADLRRLLLAFVMEGVHVAVHDKLYDYLNCDAGLSLAGCERVFSCPDDASIVVSIGGDGTLLRAVAWTETKSIPVLGINTGHLGYLTAISLNEAIENVDEILHCDFRSEQHTLLQVDAPGLIGTNMALNEVVVAKEDSSSMISVITEVDGKYLADYKADGLIVSTPTGSTAYNLSVGGPIVETTAPVWILTPIAAHSLTLRPLVIGDNSAIKLTVNGRGSRFRLVLDGRATSMPMGSVINIRRAPRKAEILQKKNRDFAKIIGEKLGFNG